MDDILKRLTGRGLLTARFVWSGRPNARELSASQWKTLVWLSCHEYVGTRRLPPAERARLAAEAGLSPRVAYHCLRDLVAAGLVLEHRGSRTEYSINPDWTPS